jgi:hypothetical protein
VILSKQDAKTILVGIRKAKCDLKALLKDAEPCDRVKGVLVALDLAELLTCEATTHEHKEPEDIILLGKLILALDFYNRDLIKRVTNSRETNGLFGD